MKRRLQFRIATVLALMAILAIPLAFYSCFQWREAQFEKMDREVRALGGHFNGVAHPVVFCGRELAYASYLENLAFSNSRISDKDLWRWPIRSSHEIEEIELDNTRVTDQGFLVFEGMTSVKELSLENSLITGKSLAILQSMTELKYLHLAGAQITDEDLKKLSALTKLKTLNLARTEIKGSGLKYLQHMKSLEYLYLDDTLVTDQAIAQLAGLKELNELSVERTKVTRNGIEALAQQLPGCCIYDGTEFSQQ